MAQELQIATGNHGTAALDETDHGVAKGRGFPQIGGNTACPIEDVRDFTVAGAAFAAIGGLHHQAQAAPLLIGHSCIRRHGPPMTGAPETDEGLDPSKRLGIERDQGREGSARRAPGKQEQLCRNPTIADGMKSLWALVLFAINGRCGRFA